MLLKYDLMILNFLFHFPTIFQTFGMATLLVLRSNKNTPSPSPSSSAIAAQSPTALTPSEQPQKKVESEIASLHDKSPAQESADRLPKFEPMIDASALYSGVRRLNLIVELGVPSALPEASLVASMLDLRAPVLPRACFLLECAAVIHAVNKQPNRLLVNAPASTSVQEGIRYHLAAYRQMARVCHSWADALGVRLAKVMAKELNLGCTFSHSSGSSTPSSVQKEEQENFFLDCEFFLCRFKNELKSLFHQQHR